MGIRDAFAQTQWFRLLAAGLAQAGLRHVVVSPGSRSTPLVCALTQQPALRMTLCIDERAAGFIALGMARANGEPTMLVCTSGTAPAHYYPAVLEASHSAVPLLLITADRPTELQGNGAAQTTDQVRLFGTHVRAFVELGTPEARTAALEGLWRKVAQGVALTRAPHPGPVHFNARAFKPLEPVASNTPDEDAVAQRVSSIVTQPAPQYHAGLLTPTRETIVHLAQRWSKAERPLLYCGPAPSYTATAALVAFATQTGWPLLSELTHPLRQSAQGLSIALIDAFELIVRTQPAHLQPDLVVCIGATPTSSAWLRWLANNPAISLDVVGENGLSDPLNRAATVVQCHPQPLFEALSRELPPLLPTARRHAWRSYGHQWQQANAVAKEHIQTYTGQSAKELTEAHVFADVAQSIGEHDLVVLGNSLPIRVAETFFAPKVRYRCLSQRGVSGIDGLVAGAIGAHLATGGRTWLLLGDVSAVHDLSSFRLIRDLAANVVVVIVDNDGGRIFDSLPVASQVSDLTAWTTPHHTSFGAVIAAMGVVATEITTRDALNRALAQLPREQGCVLWTRVLPNGAELAYRHLVRAVKTKDAV